MGNQPGTILNEAKYQRIHKERRKHYGVFPSWNKSECENTSRAKCRSSIEEPETQNTWQPYDDVLLTTDRRFTHYKANEDRIFLKDGILLRKYYVDTGSVKYYQILIPKQLINEVLRSLHGDFGKHPGITKTIIAYRKKYYYSKMAQLIKEWVMSCEKCIKELRINPQLNHLPYKTWMSTSLRPKTLCKLT